jgi:hypothetical protein
VAEALIKHLPDVSGVTVVPLTPQILGVTLLKVIEPASLVALKAAVLPAATKPVGGVKRIVCAVTPNAAIVVPTVRVAAA